MPVWHLETHAPSILFEFVQRTWRLLEEYEVPQLPALLRIRPSIFSADPDCTLRCGAVHVCDAWRMCAAAATGNPLQRLLLSVVRQLLVVSSLLWLPVWRLGSGKGDSLLQCFSPALIAGIRAATDMSF